MVANQHKKISGYRDLTVEEIDLMNLIKAFGPQLEAVCKKIAEHLHEQYSDASPDEDTRIEAAEPYRWLGIGKTNLQQGLMAITRAVAQPSFF
jgi:hypothetical protein